MERREVDRGIHAEGLLFVINEEDTVFTGPEAECWSAFAMTRSGAT